VGTRCPVVPSPSTRRNSCRVGGTRYPVVGGLAEVHPILGRSGTSRGIHSRPFATPPRWCRCGHVPSASGGPSDACPDRSPPVSYTSAQEPVPASGRIRPLPVAWSSSEAYVPAERTTSCSQARFPSPHVRPCRSGDREGPSPQGPSPSVCLIDRIHERAVFGRLGRDADRARSGPLTVLRAGVPGSTRPAVAYAISRKVGSAVVRNRLRRQLRVVCSELAADGRLDPAAYLVVVRPEAAGAPMSVLRDAMTAACRRLPDFVAPAAEPIAPVDTSDLVDRS